MNGDGDEIAGTSSDSNDAMMPTSKKLTTLAMVIEAIREVGQPKKGASGQAIKKYIMQGKSEMDQRRLNLNINKALIKGIEQGKLARPSGKNSDKASAAGSFILPKKKSPKKKAKNQTVEEDNEEHAADRTTIVQNAMKEKKVIRRKGPEKQEADNTTEMPKKVKQHKSKETKQDEVMSNDTSKPVQAKAGKKTAKKEIAVETKRKQVKKTTKNEKNGARADASDSELVVVKKGRKSMKSYSSDTEVDLRKQPKTKAKKTKVTKEKTKIEKEIVVRADSSDSELVIKKKRKSIKSYSSDTEVGLLSEAKEKKKGKAAKTKKLYSMEDENKIADPKKKTTRKKKINKE